MRRVENMMTKWKERHWLENGWVAFDGLLDGRPKERLSEWVAEVAMAPRGAAQRRHRYEIIEQRKALCCTENFREDHAALEALANGPALTEIASVLIGDEATLLNEKINYKEPGGAGFPAHQDEAIGTADGRRVMCLVAVDPMTPKNGCLEFASGHHNGLLDADAKGYILPHVAERLRWEAVPLPVGGVVFFSALVPHRSAVNGSTWPRRALYLTYRAGNEGRLRKAGSGCCLQSIAAQ